MTKQETLKAFRLGSYRCPVPPVSTAGWDDGNWCLWINQQGEWTLTAYRVTYNDGTTQVINMAPYIDLEAARAYYVGTRFEVTETTFRTGVAVDLI
jgi:hypothetical protein